MRSSGVVAHFLKGKLDHGEQANEGGDAGTQG